MLRRIGRTPSIWTANCRASGGISIKSGDAEGWVLLVAGQRRTRASCSMSIGLSTGISRCFSVRTGLLNESSTERRGSGLTEIDHPVNKPVFCTISTRQIPLTLAGTSSHDLDVMLLGLDICLLESESSGLQSLGDQIVKEAVTLIQSSPQADTLLATRVAREVVAKHQLQHLLLTLRYVDQPVHDLQRRTGNTVNMLAADSAGNITITMAGLKVLTLFPDGAGRRKPSRHKPLVRLQFKTRNSGPPGERHSHMTPLTTEASFLEKHVDRCIQAVLVKFSFGSIEQLAHHCAEAIFGTLQTLTEGMELCNVRAKFVHLFGSQQRVSAEIGKTLVGKDYRGYEDNEVKFISSMSDVRTGSERNHLQPSSLVATKQSPVVSRNSSTTGYMSVQLETESSKAVRQSSSSALGTTQGDLNRDLDIAEASTAVTTEAESPATDQQAMPDNPKDELMSYDRDVQGQDLPHVAFIAIGSNVGQRFEMLESAFSTLSADPETFILNSSFLYETEPMYVPNQERFINGVLKIRTSLQPLELLDRLQDIEQRLGRVKTVDKGPRSIDLDILTYDHNQVDHPRLTIPHALMHEREFVLRPLYDVGPNLRTMTHPHRYYSQMLADLSQSDDSMYTCCPLAPTLAPLRSTDPCRTTHIMAILNMTPDSFSDGGLHQQLSIEDLKSRISEHIAAGATIIDIGGQSSRPNAPDVTAEEEIARILPTIEAIKSLPEASKVAISVDTYRAAVAEAAIKAGAHIINDISAGLLDADMLPTVAGLGCTYIAMHMRGTPATMTSAENCSYPNGVIQAVKDELHQRVKAALAAGIPRWRIILDPGIGFAKNQNQNLEILRNFDRLRTSRELVGFPWLIGSSRKGFIGKITGVKEARERDWGTAATVTAAVAGGADIVRVHDVGQMAKVAKMADAIYRTPQRAARA